MDWWSWGCWKYWRSHYLSIRNRKTNSGLRESWFQECKRTQVNPKRKLLGWSTNSSAISGDNEAILDFRDLFNVQFKNDNVQALNTKWDEVLSAISDRRYKMQVENFEALAYLLQAYAQETTFGDKKCDYCRWKLVAERHLQQQINDSHLKARNRDEDRPATGAPIKGKKKGKGE